MQFIKQICLIVVLGALGYGAYATLTGKPANDPPLETVNWDSPPRIELPGGNGLPPPSSNTAGSTSPGGAAPRYDAPSGTAPSVGATNGLSGSPGLGAAAGGAILPPPAGSSGTAGSAAASASITGVRSDAAAAPYPNTNIPPGRFDAGGAVPLTPVGSLGSAAGSPPAPSSSTSAAAATPTPSGVQPASAVGGASVYPTSPDGTPATVATPPGAASVGAADGDKLPISEVQALIGRNELAKALDALSRWFDSPNLPPEADVQVTALLDQLAGTVIYSREHWLEPPHVVAQGESLQAVAAKYGVSPELLMKINGIADPLYLPTGAQLKVVKGPFDVLVDKSRRRLTLFVDGMYAGSFPVGFGRDQIIADGNYAVRAKTANPPYQAADLALGSDDPRNPLGRRWIDLGSGLGIHGTNDPATYLSDEGRGVIRLAPRDADDVFDITTVGSRVVIRP